MLGEIITGIADHLEVMSGIYHRMKEVRARIGDYGKFSKEDELYIVGVGLRKKKDTVEKDLAVTVPKKEKVEEFPWDLDSLVYSAEDQGDDRALRAEANKRINALRDRRPGEERWEKWMRVYDLMRSFAVVNFPLEVDNYRKKKIAEGRPKSPTGYDWSWINLAVSNEYWRRLLIICIEIEESKDRRWEERHGCGQTIDMGNVSREI